MRGLFVYRPMHGPAYGQEMLTLWLGIQIKNPRNLKLRGP